MNSNDIEARLAFTFPGVDVGATGLNPFDADDRLELVRLATPGLDTLAVDLGPEAGARMADTIVTVRSALAQFIVRDTMDVWPTVLRLRDDGLPDVRIHELLFESVVDHLLPTTMSDEPTDTTVFVRALHALPTHIDDIDDPLDDLEWMIDEWRDDPNLDTEGDIAQLLRSTIHDDLVAAIGDDFISLDSLTETFAPTLRLRPRDTRDVLRMYLSWWVPAVFIAPDDTVADDRTIVDGVRFRHRLSDAEARTERLDDSIDLALLLDGFDLGEVNGLGPLRATYRTAIDGDETRSSGAVRIIDGPAGWLDGASGGEVLAVTRRGAAVEAAVEAAVVADREPVDDASVVDALRHARDVLVDDMPVDIYRAFRIAAVHARGFGPDLGRPLSELLIAAGWSIDEDMIAPADFDWDRHRAEQRTRGDLSIMLRAGVDSADEAPAIHALVTELFGEDVAFDSTAMARPVADDRADAVSALLSRPGFAAAAFTLALGVEPSPTALSSVRELAVSLVDRARPTNVSGPARLGLLAADLEGRVDVVADLLGRAHLNAVGDDALCSIAGDLELDRGRLDAARRHYVRGDVDLPDGVFGPIADASTFAVAGRNDPCPCGSGQKHKRCHGRPGGPPLTDVRRARLLIARLGRHDLRRRHFGVHRWHRLAGLVVDEEWMTDDAEMFLPFLETLSWFEDGGLANYLETRGPLLLAEDRLLAESWIGAPIVVGHREGDHVALTDGRTVAQTMDLGGYGAGPPPIGSIGRLVMLDGAPTLIRCAWAGGDLDDVAARLAAAGNDADAVAEAIAALRRRRS